MSKVKTLVVFVLRENVFAYDVADTTMRFWTKGELFVYRPLEPNRDEDGEEQPRYISLIDGQVLYEYVLRGFQTKVGEPIMVPYEL